jgi:chemotaxis protein MotB
VVVSDEGEERPRTYLEEIVCEQGAPPWVVTFGDMISLLLTFFILLLSFSTVDPTKFQRLSGSIRAAFGSPGTARNGQPASEEPDGSEPGAAELVERLRRSLGAASRLPGRVNVEVFDTWRGVVVLVPAEGLFVEGTDQLRGEAGPLLDDVLREAVPIQDRFELAVEAHTAADGARLGRFGSAFGLTAAQALAVADYLRRPGGLRPGRVRPVGRGSAPVTIRPGRSGSASAVALLFLSAPLERR